MSAWDFVVGPFADFGFMRRALIGCVALSLGACPLGVVLILRRMSLIGDAMSHAILPGAAVGFLIAGFSPLVMAIGGLGSGLLVAGLAGLVSRFTTVREDASFAAFYLASLGLGVLLVSLRGSNVDLLHVLFGTVLALDNSALLLISSVASISLIAIALLYRALVAACLDPAFLRTLGSVGGVVHAVFLVLVVLNLVGGFQALGTLMVIGIMMLPAAASRFWAASVAGQMTIAVLIGILSSFVGLLASYHLDLPSSPAIILAASAIYVASLTLGPNGGLLRESLGGGRLRTS